MARLRRSYPNVMALERERRIQARSREQAPAAGERLTPLAYAEGFYEAMTGQPVDDGVRAVLAAAWQRAREEEE